MLVHRAVTQTSRCSNCHRAVLNAFLASGGHNPLLLSQAPPPRRRLPVSQNRSLSLTTRRVSQEKAFLDRGDHEEKNENVSELETLVDEAPPEQAEQTDKPWYLQVNTLPPSPARPPTRLELPELPPDPPPILKATLDFILYQLGLDDLKLLDLRDLDPPPALGANLLMIIGTARSEKHLHMSGERLRGWMRTEHKLSARADGLIGRGELKLRLRRKAKRARILSRVGSVDTGKADDGLHSAWVCVTVQDTGDAATVDAEAALSRTSGEFAGFQDDEAGSKLVIQMLTAEKREELDLEGLWGEVLWRDGRKKAKWAAAEEDALATGPGEADSEGLTSRLRIGRGTVAGSPQNWRRDRPYSQVRQFSHSSRRQSIESIAPEGVAVSTTSLPQLRLAQSRVSAAFEAFVERLSSPDEIEHAARSDLSMLQAHIEFLNSHKTGLVELLGRGASDVDSTPFLRSFYSNIPLFPGPRHWEFILVLASLGLHNRCPGFSGTDVTRIFRDMQSAMIEISPSTFIIALRLMLMPHTTARSTPQSRSSVESDDLRDLLRKKQPELSLMGAAELLEAMRLQGYKLTNQDVRWAFEMTLSMTLAVHQGSVQESLQRAQMFLALSSHFGAAPPPGMESEMEKLKLFTELGFWDGVWDMWHSFPTFHQPREKDMYLTLLEYLSKRGEAAEILRALRKLMTEMAKETSPVRLDADIGDAILECMKAIDPKIGEVAAKKYKSTDELHRLWRHCKAISQEERPFLHEYDDD